jgi:hypothetical protein
VNRARVIVFAKAPRPGHAKTRLIPVLGAEGAALLARRMLAWTLEQALTADVGPVEACLAPGPGHADWDGVDLPAGVLLTEQGEGDLGHRLARASRRGLAAGEAAILLGTDAVDLTAAVVRRAADRLRACDAVLCPAADGGYALLALSRHDPEVFRDIPWSTSRVCRETLARFRKLGWKVDVGPTLHDVDEPDDLDRVPEVWLKGIRGEIHVRVESTLTCPECGHATSETMPTDACLYFFQCPACATLLTPRRGHCCVFCSYGDVPCPPVQLAGDSRACCR